MSAQAEDMAQDAANKAPEVADRASKTIHSTADTVEEQVRQKLSSAAGPPCLPPLRSRPLVLLPDSKISLLCGACTRRLGENPSGFVVQCACWPASLSGCKQPQKSRTAPLVVASLEYPAVAMPHVD